MGENNTLEQGTIDKLYRHAGVLDLVFDDLRRLQDLYRKAENSDIDGSQFEKQAVDIAIELGERLACADPQLLNDMGFLKHLYNRQRKY